jgi:hypothetical protein
MTRVFAKLCAMFAVTSLPFPANAVTQRIGSDNTAAWAVYETHLDSSGNPVTTNLGQPQYVCLNAPNTPANCPTGGVTSYGYNLPGWTADLSSQVPNAKWIWASVKSDGTPINGTTKGAANAQYSFKTFVYLCGSHPQDATIWVAADDKVEVYLNGATVPVFSWTGSSSVGKFTIPAASLKASPTPNIIELKVTNLADPPDCSSDQYQCNPAGVLFGGEFSDELSANPTCSNPPGQVGDRNDIGACSAPQVGDEYQRCICLAGQAGWFPEPDSCTTPTPPPTSKMCPDASGNPTVPVKTQKSAVCPAPTTMGTATQTCQTDGTWSSIDVSKCTLPTVSTLPTVGPDGICRSAQGVLTASCPIGQTCGTCSGPMPQKPWQCFFGIDCPVRLQSAEGYCDCSKYQGEPLGAPCTTSYACASGYCDTGPNTRQTNLCMPRGNTGQKGDPCTADNQCSNSIPLKCMDGLQQNANGSWQPGHCI